MSSLTSIILNHHGDEPVMLLLWYSCSPHPNRSVRVVFCQVLVEQIYLMLICPLSSKSYFHI